jgi:xanthine dehydrogenase YagS FAD-binding subunit
MILFPTTVEQATASTGEYRAGGTDLQDRRRNGKAAGPIIDLKYLPLNAVTEADVADAPQEVDVARRTGAFGGVDSSFKGLIIGARTTVATIARDQRVQAGWPALSRTARGLATPQIREMATIGGNLLQHTRCPYARHAELSCAKSGGHGCPSRDGDHHFGVVIDQGPCVAPHPSSLAVALLVYDAVVQINEAEMLPVALLWGDGSDPTKNHALRHGELITAIHLPPAVARERGGYVRAISRFEAEWPLAEAAVRIATSTEGVVTEIGVAVGGVANTPLRLPEVEQALLGQILSEQNIANAAKLATRRCKPLPNTGYKVPLLQSVISDALHQASQNL